MRLVFRPDRVVWQISSRVAYMKSNSIHVYNNIDNMQYLLCNNIIYNMSALYILCLSSGARVTYIIIFYVCAWNMKWLYRVHIKEQANTADIIYYYCVYTHTHMYTASPRRDVYNIYISKYTFATATSFDSCAIIISFYKLTETLRATRGVSLKYLPKLSNPPPPHHHSILAHKTASTHAVHTWCRVGGHKRVVVHSRCIL